MSQQGYLTPGGLAQVRDIPSQDKSVEAPYLNQCREQLEKQLHILCDSTNILEGICYRLLPEEKDAPRVAEAAPINTSHTGMIVEFRERINYFNELNARLETCIRRLNAII